MYLIRNYSTQSISYSFYNLYQIVQMWNCLAYHCRFMGQRESKSRYLRKSCSHFLDCPTIVSSHREESANPADSTCRRVSLVAQTQRRETEWKQVSLSFLNISVISGYQESLPRIKITSNHYNKISSSRRSLALTCWLIKKLIEEALQFWLHLEANFSHTPTTGLRGEEHG